MKRLRAATQLILICGWVLLWPSSAWAQDPAVAAEPLELAVLPELRLEALEPAVRTVIEERRRMIDQRLSLDEARELDPKEVAGLYGELGFLLHAHDLIDAAAVSYANAETVMPEDPRWPYASGLAARSLGNLDASAAAFERTLELLPRNAAALIQLAETRLEQNMPLVARAHLLHALELSTESPTALALLGQVALSSRRYDRAVRYLERALAQVPEANRLHYPLALAYRGLGDMEQAREHMARRGEVGVKAPDPISTEIEARKTGERVMLLEGRRAFKVGRFEEAAALFQKALDSDPASVRARVNLASALAAAGKEAEAIGHFEAILAAHPDNSAAAFNLAGFRLAEGRNPEAIQLLRTAVASDSRDAESRKLLADTYARLGEFSEAWKWVQEAVQLTPTDQELWLLGGELNQRLGRHGEARAWLEKGFRSMPDQGLLAHALARLLATSPDLEVRDGERAVDLATRVANSTQDAGHWHTVALALGEAGRCEDGVGVLKQLREKVSADSRGAMAAEIARYEQGPPCRPPAP